jgi:hypothetical protein
LEITEQIITPTGCRPLKGEGIERFFFQGFPENYNKIEGAQFGLRVEVTIKAGGS